MKERIYRILYSGKYLWSMLALMVFVMAGFFLNYLMHDARVSDGYFTYTNLAAAESFLLSGEYTSNLIAYCVVAPLVASLVCSSLFSEDEAAGMSEAIRTRERREVYHLKNILAVFLSAFLLSAIPLALNTLCVMLAFPLRDACMRNFQFYEPAYGIQFRLDNPFEILAQYHPYLTIWLGIVFHGLVSAVVALFCYGVSVLARLRFYYCAAIAFLCYLLWNLAMRAHYSPNPQVVWSFWPYMQLLFSWNSLKGFAVSFSLFLLAGMAMVFMGERVRA